MTTNATPDTPDPRPAVEAVRFQGPAVRGRTKQAAEEEQAAPQASGSDEVAMHRLRHPFTVETDTTPPRT
jgi:hypothetical protein